MTVNNGPVRITQNDFVLENTIIIVDPTSDEDHSNDIALGIYRKENVVIRNVIIYHAANGKGINAWRCKNLTIENVQIIAYGNELGAGPCPTRLPFGGFECTNIKVWHTEGLKIHNVEVENGSRGISMRNCSGAQLTSIVAKNMRGPNPGGQCVQFEYSHDSLLDNFFCKNDIDASWPGDSISAWRSSNVVISNGVVEGSNAPYGMCVMFEGSEEGIHGGRIENVEARYCGGCFSGFPATNLFQTGNTCAAPICEKPPE
jgi:hypothetical protein